MARVILTAAALLCLVALPASHPCAAASGGVEIGLKGGFNLANVEMITDAQISETLDQRMCFGGGFELPGRSMSFFMEGRYSLGLSEIGAAVEGQSEAEPQKNRGIHVLGGLRF